MLLDVLGQPFIIIDGMPVNGAIGVHMGEHVTVFRDRVLVMEMALGVMEVTCFARGSLGRCDQRSLQRERHRGCHHGDDSEPSQEWPQAKAQVCSSSGSSSLYIEATYSVQPFSPDVCRKHTSCPG
jgi:hypothetical protein